MEGITREARDMRRIRLAELTSSMGAGVLGLGIGVVAAQHLKSVGWLLLFVGVLVHGWGMLDKHRLETGAGMPDVWWSTVLCWICWLVLEALVVYVVVRAI